MVLCRQVRAACEKMYKIMAEVIKSDKRSWVGVLLGGCVDMGFGTYVLSGHLQ